MGDKATRSDFSVGAAAKFCGAWCDAGGTPNELNALAENSKQLKAILLVVRGVEHIVDLDADPGLLPEGWKVEEHKKGGKWKFDPKQVKLHFTNRVVGHEVYKELANEPVMNSNLLDWYLDHPEFIPEEWKDKYIFFWGTIYRSSEGNLCVRYLCWDHGKWLYSFGWLHKVWCFKHSALVRTS